ncbi:MAG: hypothetical protein K8I30_19455, partial [Anaerolineae bacterium]|nr:hypothetical protein [Anaerolineae bacterium]
YFTVFMIAAQALAVLLIAPRRLPRLLLAYGVSALAFLPFFPIFYQQLTLEVVRAGAGDAVSLQNIGKYAAAQPTSLATLHQLIMLYTAGQPAFVILLIATAFGLGLRFRRALTLTTLWLIGTLTLFFGVNLFMSVYNVRYPFMVVPAIALFAGAALSRLPARSALVIVIGVLGILVHTEGFKEPKEPHRELMRALSQNYMPGDRIWYNFNTGARGSSLMYESDYYLQKEAPNLDSDMFVWNAPEDFQGVRRLWDVRPYWLSVPDDVQAALSERTITETYPFGGYEIRLYELPPGSDYEPITFSDLMEVNFVPEDFTRGIYEPGRSVRVKSWWRAVQSVPRDYSYGLFLRNTDGAVLAQNDQGLTIQAKSTSQWMPSPDYGFSTLELGLPATLPPDVYDLWLAVYYWENPEPLLVTTSRPVRVDSGLILLGQITVEPPAAT